MLFFLSLFSFFLMFTRVSFVSLAIPSISSFHHVAPRHKHTMTHTHNNNNNNNNVCTCVLALRLVSRSVCNDLSTLLLTFIVVLLYTVSWGSIHSYSVFLPSLGSLLPFSFSQVSHLVKLFRQGITCRTTQRHIILHVFLFRQNYKWWTSVVGRPSKKHVYLSLSLSQDLPLFWSVCVSTALWRTFWPIFWHSCWFSGRCGFHCARYSPPH